jgi:hypothetical protein
MKRFLSPRASSPDTGDERFVAASECRAKDKAFATLEDSMRLQI